VEIARALILAEPAGADRPWAAAPSGPKHLFPIANQPILFHNLDALRSAGVLEATILATGETGTALRQAVGDGRRWGISIRHDEWAPVHGVRGALAIAGDFLAGEPVLVQQGDALLRDRMHGHIAAFAREQLDALALRLGPAELHGPALPEPGFLLSPRAVSILADGLHDPANLVAGVRARGGRVRVQDVEGCLPCHGDQETLLDSNRRVLETIAPDFEPDSLEDDCTLQGAVIVHPTARIRRSLVRGPAIIGPGAVISDAYVGPYTSIGSNVVIEGSQIEYSIVLAGAELRFVGARLESSVIGRSARIARGFQLPGAIRMSVGEGAEIVLT
jgi:glucose-1-phosphate thymidylyltransferase